MPLKLIPLLLISGPVGVGKTSVASEVSDLLCEKNISHTFIDLDQLRYTYPRPPGDRFGSRLGLQNLRDMWRNASSVGSRNLILSSVIEAREDVVAIQQMVPGAKPSVYQLRATVETLEARVRKREIGKGLEWHLRRSAELAEIFLTRAEVPMDFEVWTDELSVSEIAGHIVERMNWDTTK